jgi:hypothetical protein
VSRPVITDKRLVFSSLESGTCGGSQPPLSAALAASRLTRRLIVACFRRGTHGAASPFHHLKKADYLNNLVEVLERLKYRFPARRSRLN